MYKRNHFYVSRANILTERRVSASERANTIPANYVVKKLPEYNIKVRKESGYLLVINLQYKIQVHIYHLKLITLIKSKFHHFSFVADLFSQGQWNNESLDLLF